MSENLARVVDLAPEVVSFREAVRHGLSRNPKSLSPMYFYDEQGAALFEEICRLPEYYPTRAETAILRTHAADIAARIGPQAHLVEYGSGATEKVRPLLDALEDPVAYTPVDISAEQLAAAAADLAASYPAIEVTGIIADYTRPFTLPPPRRRPAGKRAALFLGSTIGNFGPEEALSFMQQAARRLSNGGLLLIGADLRKDPNRLHAAYNDSAGITARFNLNLLSRINRELDGSFDLGAFDHYAFYNPGPGRIEMHLVSRRAQRVTVAGQSFTFDQGESLHTENSYKFTVEGFRTMARRAGFTPEAVWFDEENLFSLHLLRAS
jgi:dimethylhistidine N-methyltransferase